MLFWLPFSFFPFSCPSSMMEVLSPLFELDPLFRRTFLFCVPPVTFGKIATSGLFPQVEVCTTLARGLSVKDYVMPDEVNSF